jgi:hypothetical protein
MRLFGRGQSRTTVTAPPGGPAPGGLADDEDDELVDGLVDELPADEPARGAGGPVMLTLTTREQIEKTQTEPKIIRVRPGRGAFGGTAGGHGCSHH